MSLTGHYLKLEEIQRERKLLDQEAGYLKYKNNTESTIRLARIYSQIQKLMTEEILVSNTIRQKEKLSKD